MDYNYGNDNHTNSTGPMPQSTDKNSNSLAIASLVLGIIAIVTSCCCFSGILFGAIAVVLALLSRGSVNKFDNKALWGLITGIAGILLGILFLISIIIYTNVITKNENFKDIINQYEQDHGTYY